MPLKEFREKFSKVNSRELKLMFDPLSYKIENQNKSESFQLKAYDFCIKVQTICHKNKGN